MEEEIATTGLEVGQQADQVGEATAKSIYAPRSHHLNFGTGHCLEQGIESWTLIPSLGPADPLVLEDGDDFPAGPLSDVEEDAALVLGRLLVR